MSDVVAYPVASHSGFGALLTLVVPLLLGHLDIVWDSDGRAEDQMLTAHVAATTVNVTYVSYFQLHLLFLPSVSVDECVLKFACAIELDLLAVALDADELDCVVSEDVCCRVLDLLEGEYCSPALSYLLDLDERIPAVDARMIYDLGDEVFERLL